ncbi:hypothetical protein Hanom_Chr04g00282241 [Helianthus anomalus]
MNSTCSIKQSVTSIIIILTNFISLSSTKFTSSFIKWLLFQLKKTPTTTKSLFKIKNNTHHHHHRSGGYRIQCVRVMIQQCLIDPMVVSRSSGGQQIRC